MEKGANISSFNVAQLSRLHDLKCFSLIHFNLVNMFRQVANFLGMASLRHLHIKRVGGRPHFLVRGGRSQLGHLLREGRLGLAREVSQAVVSDGPRGLGVGGRERLDTGARTGIGPSLEDPSAGAPRHHLKGALSYLRMGRPWWPHGCEGRGRIYPQVRLLNRV